MPVTANARPGMTLSSPRLPVETESVACFWVGAAQWIPLVPSDNLWTFGLSESSDGRADSNYGLERTFAARKSLNPALSPWKAALRAMFRNSCRMKG